MRRDPGEPVSPNLARTNGVVPVDEMGRLRSRSNFSDNLVVYCVVVACKVVVRARTFLLVSPPNSLRQVAKCVVRP